MTPRARIPTSYGVYTFDTDNIRALSLSPKHRGERFIPLKEAQELEPWVLTIELAHIEDHTQAPSLWSHVKDWWQTRKLLKQRRFHETIRR